MSMLQDEILRRRAAVPLLHELMRGVPAPSAVPTANIDLPKPIPVTADPSLAPGPPGERTPVTGPYTSAERPTGPIHMGTPVAANAGNFERLMAQHATLASADPSMPVKRTDWGYEVLPPEQSPSRLRHAGQGAAHGAIIAGQATQGDPWGTLAGAAVGALTGGVSPALMQAFTRRQEQAQAAGDLSTEQNLQLRNAQIGETLAQGEQRRLEPHLRAAELRAQNERFDRTEQGRNNRAAAANKTRVETAAEANRLRQQGLAETERHNRAVESRPGTATEEITVGGRKFRVSANTAARILEERTNGRASKQYEAQLEADLEREAAEDHIAKRAAAEQQATNLRAERDRLSAGAGARTNESRIKELDRQIAQAEQEARYRQTEADNSYSRERKARSRAGAANANPASSGGGGTSGGKAFDLGRWKRDHPGQDPSAVIQRAKDAGMRIIE